MLKDLKKALDGESEDMEMESMDDESMDSESEDSELPYDAYGTELGEVLGLDEDRAMQLRDIICGLVREELDMGSEEPEEEKPKKKGKSDLALVLG